jgi:hemerythrin-like domain-containing protein
MPVTIGAKLESDFSDPLGLLHDCHRRIERFSAVLAEIAVRRAGGPLTESERASLAAALRYFREAAPRHTEDEEVSLFPRLREASGEGLDALERLETEHVTAQALHEELDLLGKRWLAENGLDAEAAARFREAAQRLEALYAAHIEVEDNELFPRARRVLSARNLAEIAGEMKARRG